MRLPLRFSLRSLMLLILAGAAATAAAMKWDAWQLTLTLRPTGYHVSDAKFSPDGKLLLTHASTTEHNLNEKDTTTVWNRSGTKLYETDWCFDMGASGYDGADFKFGSRWLLMQYAHHGSNAQLVDLNSKKMLFPEKCNSVYVSFSRDGRRCAAMHTDDQNRFWIAVYDLESGRLFREVRANADLQIGEYREVRLSPDGRRIIAIAEEATAQNGFGNILVYCDLETGTMTKSQRSFQGFYFEDLAFSEDGFRAIVWDNNSFRVMDAATDKILFECRDTTHFCYEYRALNEGLRYILYEREGKAYRLDLNANPLLPVLVPNILLSKCNVVGEWIAWEDGENVRLRNFVKGFEPVQAVRKAANDLWMFSNSGDCLVFISNSGAYCFHKTTHAIYTSNVFLIPSPDTTRIFSNQSPTQIFAFSEDRPALATLWLPLFDYYRTNWSPDSNAIIVPINREALVWSRVRDDSPGAFLFLPELWLTIAFFCAFLFSVRSDLRRLRSPV